MKRRCERLITLGWSNYSILNQDARNVNPELEIIDLVCQSTFRYKISLSANTETKLNLHC